MPLTGILGENGAGICWLGRLIDDDNDDDVSAVASSVEFDGIEYSKQVFSLASPTRLVVNSYVTIFQENPKRILVRLVLEQFFRTFAPSRQNREQEKKRTIIFFQKGKVSKKDRVRL